MDYEKQHCHVSYTINELNADGTYHSLHETQINRFFLVQEMSFFLSQSRLSPLRWFAGFREDEQISADTWHIVAVARKGMKP
jgi:hypothetical protein